MLSGDLPSLEPVVDGSLHIPEPECGMSRPQIGPNSTLWIGCGPCIQVWGEEESGLAAGMP